MLGVNRVVLVGTLGTYGVSVHSTPHGTAHATLTLVLNEQGQDGKAHMTLVGCELWGKRVAAVAALAPGTPVGFEGRLRRTKDKERDVWQMIVSGCDITPLFDTQPSLPKRCAS